MSARGVGEETLWKIGYRLGPAHGYSRGADRPTTKPAFGMIKGAPVAVPEEVCLMHMPEDLSLIGQKVVAAAQAGSVARFGEFSDVFGEPTSKAIVKLANSDFVATMPVVSARQYTAAKLILFSGSRAAKGLRADF